jgi:hypothetical protein
MKTVVEWLVEELGFVEYEGLSQPEWIKNLILQAKEMEKQQIIDAYEEGTEEGIMRHSSEEYNIEYYVNAEQYYNENYKQDETH